MKEALAMVSRKGIRIIRITSRYFQKFAQNAYILRIV